MNTYARVAGMLHSVGSATPDWVIFVIRFRNCIRIAKMRDSRTENVKTMDTIDCVSYLCPASGHGYEEFILIHTYNVLVARSGLGVEKP